MNTQGDSTQRTWSGSLPLALFQFWDYIPIFIGADHADGSDPSNHFTLRNGMERRRNHRLPLRASGQLILRDTVWLETETRDLSLRGASVGHGFPHTLDQPCVLHLFVGDGSVSSVTLQGHIVREGSTGLGIEFGAIDVQDFQVLLTHLVEHAESPDVIHQEVAQGETPLLMDWNLSSPNRPQNRRDSPSGTEDPASPHRGRPVDRSLHPSGTDPKEGWQG